MSRPALLPLTGRPVPTAPSWFYELEFLLEAGLQSLKTETTYRSGLRLLADWLQHFKRDGFTLEDEWPLRPEKITNQTLLQYRSWLIANRAEATVTTYMAAVVGYLQFLEGRDLLPAGVVLGKLQRQFRQQRKRGKMSEHVVDLDLARQQMPKIVQYYDQLPLPPADEPYNLRLSLLRNRALVQVLYATAARVSEVVSLNRTNVGQGKATHTIITGKGGRSRTLHIRSYAQQAIQAYLAERKDSNPALFVAHSRNAQNARLTITTAHNVVKHAVRALKLDESLSAHDFRHFRATQLLREGMPLEVVQEFLGHADITTTRNIYAPVLGVQVVSEWLDNLDQPPAVAAQKQLVDPTLLKDAWPELVEGQDEE